MMRPRGADGGLPPIREGGGGVLFFGPAGIPAGARTSEEGLRLVAGLGLNALEVEFVRGVRMAPEEARKLGRLARELGIRLSAHAPYYINLNSADSAVREKSIGHILSTLRAARLLGARIIVVHAGFYSGRTPPEATEVILRGLAECRERAGREGLDGVVIGLETMGRRASWGTLEEMRSVVGKVDGVFPVVDFSHIHARCGGCLRTREDFEGVLRELESFDPPFLHCHFTGVEWGPSGERRHLEVASRSPDFALLAPLLRDLTRDITLICESPLLEKDALLLKRMAERARAE